MSLAKMPEYHAWRAAIRRCHNPKAQAWDKYGGRGIAVCDEWRASFDAFFAHVGARPSPAHSLDRIDNDLGYLPGNVRWATAAEQVRNRRNSVSLEILAAVRGMHADGYHPQLIAELFLINKTVIYRLLGKKYGREAGNEVGQ